MYMCEYFLKLVNMYLIQKILILLIVCFSLFNTGLVFASEIPNDFSFNEDLEIKDSEINVKYLQIFLNRYSDTRVAKNGVGSHRNETEYFGMLTKKAVIKFQEKYHDEVLAPWGFVNGTGIVGSTTRAKINKLLLEQRSSSDDFYISSLYPYQGDTIIVKVGNIEPNEIIVADFLNKSYIFYSINSETEKIAIIPINAKIVEGEYPITIHSSLNPAFSKIINVLNRNFPVTRLAITTKLEEEGYSAESIQENVLKENKILFSEILNEPITEFLFNSTFNYPLDVIKNVGAYGNIRKNGDVYLQHLGVDLDAKEGTPIYSINTGIVKFARETTSYGKTIVVDHGGGIRSMYLHLSEFLVKENDIVEKGETIAYSGNTGYSIAPHLHLSINIYGYSISPLYFLENVNKNIE